MKKDPKSHLGKNQTKKTNKQVKTYNNKTLNCRDIICYKPLFQELIFIYFQNDCRFGISVTVRSCSLENHEFNCVLLATEVIFAEFRWMLMTFLNSWRKIWITSGTLIDFMHEFNRLK